MRHAERASKENNDEAGFARSDTLPIPLVSHHNEALPGVGRTRFLHPRKLRTTAP